MSYTMTSERNAKKQKPTKTFLLSIIVVSFLFIITSVHSASVEITIEYEVKSETSQAQSVAQNAPQNITESSIIEEPMNPIQMLFLLFSFFSL